MMDSFLVDYQHVLALYALFFIFNKGSIEGIDSSGFDVQVFYTCVLFRV